MRLEMLSQSLSGLTVDEATANEIRGLLDELASYPAAVHEDELFSRLEVADTYIRVGKSLATNPNRINEVRQAEKLLLALLQTVREDFPKSDVAREQIGYQLRTWAYALPWKGEHLTHAEKAYREAVSVFEQLTVDFPEKWSAWELLADSHRCVGRVLEVSGKIEAAEEEHRRAVEIYDTHAASFDEHGIYNSERATGYFALAALLARTGRSTEAENLYRRGCAVVESDPNGCNGLAWRLATSRTEQFRDPARAVELAQMAVELAPADGNIWNTLGVAQYCAGQWQPAVEAIGKSMDLRNGGDAFNWFFLAMAYWQLDNKDEARKQFEKSVEWMDKNQPKNEELLRFCAEAAELLGISEPAPSTDAATQP